MGKIKTIELKIPNLGEAEETEVIELSAKKGDIVSVNDPLIVLESEKAAMEVPADVGGKLLEIKVKEGQNVSEGMIFAVIETEETNKVQTTEKSTQEEKPEINEERQAAKKDIEVKGFDNNGINAGPAVRKIARELDIKLSAIKGTGKNNLITKDDLKKYVHHGLKKNVETYADLAFLEKFGTCEQLKQTKIRKIGAKNLSNSWKTIPHVTHFEEIDITALEQYRKKLNSKSEVKISPLSFIVHFVTKALKEFEVFNSSIIESGLLALRKYINIGIAVDTEDGLIVPVIHDADKLSVNEIAYKISDLAKKSKDKKLLEKDLSGSTFTISSLGPMGGIGFTPIINPPEVGIIGVSRSKNQYKLEGDKMIPQIILPISLSYDHRAINGADAGKFMLFIKQEIESGEFE